MGHIQNERAVWSPTSEHMYMLRTIDRADAANQSTLRAFAGWLAETRGLQPNFHGLPEESQKSRGFRRGFVTTLEGSPPRLAARSSPGP